MRHILTTHYLNRLRPHKIERFVWDTQLPGYGVRAYPSGTITFLAQVWDVGALLHGSVTSQSRRRSVPFTRYNSQRHAPIVFGGGPDPG